jgi:type II secretory pathway predicted ATPase ExeA
MMAEDSAGVALTEPQRAAVAKLACALEAPGAVAVLCGPAGVGKTTVLEKLADVTACARGVQRFVDVQPQEPASADLPPLVLLDDADDADDGGIGRLVASWRKHRPDVRLVLAGTGRLLTLVARDTRVEQAVRLRAALRPFTAAESADLVTMALRGARPQAASMPPPAEVLQTIHEIAAGIPATVARLAVLARVLVDADPDRPLTVDDVEAIHRRLSPQAA